MAFRRRLFDLLTRHRVAVVATYGLLLAASGLGLRQLRVDYSAERFFVFGGEERAAFDRLKRHFPQEDLQVSAFLAVDGPLGVSDFRRLERVADAFGEIGLRSVRWLGGVELVELDVVDGQESVTFLRLADEEALDEERLRSALEARRDHPIWTGTLWDPSQRVFAVHGFLAPERNTDEGRREVTAFLQARIDSLAPAEGRMVLNGLPVLRVTVPLALSSDLGRLLGIGILLALVLITLYFRRTTLALLSLAGVVPAMILTLAAMGFADRPLTVLTSSTPIVVLVVGICDAIHLMVGARRRWLEGRPPREAVVDAFTPLSRACFFTSLTTAAGFLGLSVTGIPLIAEYGVVTAIAVLATFVVSVTLLPALLAFARDFGPETTRLARWSHWVVNRSRAALDLRPGWVLLSFGVVLVAGVTLASGLRVRAYLIDDLRPGDPILEELRWLESTGFGVFQVNLLVDHRDLPGHDPQALGWAEEMASFAERDPLVLGSLTLPAIVRELGRAAGLDAGSSASPFARREGTARWSARTVRELLFVAELQGDDAVRDVYRLDEGVSQLVLFVRDGGSRATSDFLDRLEARIEEDPPPGGIAAVTGTVKLSEVLWDQLLGRFLPGVAFSVLLVWAVLSWMFRSARAGAVALLPNLFPLAVLAGILRIGGFDLKPSTAIVFSMAFGIVVDDTIHILAALAGSEAHGPSLRTRLEQIVGEVGPALVLSTVVVCVGFGVLMASRFEALFLIGLLTSLAALLALVADLVALPHLFRMAGIVRAPDPVPRRSAR